MAQAELQKEFTFPAGGIADFYKDDEELAAMDREDAQRAFGNNGIANFQDVATRMASYGRYGDDKLVHAETGELIVPKALIEDNPKLRDSIFGHLRDMGIEDPERYVVGSGANSINPDTGLPEFFFKKIFKKVSRAIKKVSKKVVKVVKKAAPVIIPFALNAIFPGLGAIYAGALGSGIGTLVQGGSLKDAMKNALIGGAIGGATAGISGGLNAAPGQTFSQGAVTGIKKAASLSNLTTAGQQLATGQFGQAGLDAVNMSPDAFGTYGSGGEQYMASAPTSTSDIVSQATDISQPYGGGIQNEMVGGPQAFAAPPEPAAVLNQPQSVDLLAAQQGGLPMGPDMQFANISSVTPDAANISTDFIQSPDAFADTSAGRLTTTPSEFMTKVDTSAVGGGNFMDTAKSYYGTATDYLFQGGQSDAAVNLAKEKAGQAYLKDMAAAGIAPTQAGLEAAKAAAGPGMLATYGPSLALAGTAAYAGGMFDTPEEPSDEELLEQLGPSGYELYKANKAQYGLKAETPQYAQGPIAIPTTFSQGLSPLPPLAVAEGGEIFPRRVGGIMPNEGTPGKDSVRAMLMPGEFVMTTDAVRGLGNGNNDQGIRNMYDMMRGLEAKGRATA